MCNDLLSLEVDLMDLGGSKCSFCSCIQILRLHWKYLLIKICLCHGTLPLFPRLLTVFWCGFLGYIHRQQRHISSWCCCHCPCYAFSCPCLCSSCSPWRRDMMHHHHHHSLTWWSIICLLLLLFFCACCSSLGFFFTNEPCFFFSLHLFIMLLLLFFVLSLRFSS